MKKLMLIVACCFISLIAVSQSSVKKEHIKQYLELTGSGKLGKQIVENMVTSLKKIYTAAGDAFWDEFVKEVNPNELIELLIPIYEKYYTDEEVLQLIAFYNTALGKKIILNAPLISKDSYDAGSEWGKKIGEKVAQKMIDAESVKKEHN